MIRWLAVAALGLSMLGLGTPTGAAAAPAADCPGHPDALGTSRVLEVDAGTTPRVGRKQFPGTLPLAPHEVVLTFDDGPWPGTTSRILDALAGECVKATFFVIGQNAVAHPALLRREVAEGHSVGTHTWSHPLLSTLPIAAAWSEIDRGIAAVDGVLSTAGSTSAGRLFRFPGFAATPALLERLHARGVTVFGADLWASDWNRMTPESELRLVLDRLERTGGGIVLLHDTKLQTAAMLPSLLRELKVRNYRIVSVVPKPPDR